MFTHPSGILKQLYPSLYWNVKTNEPAIFLTFDDGPTPGVTEWILEILKSYNAKATFFCIGKNVEMHPELYQQIVSEGHAVGNHTYQHLNGWKVSKNNYLEDVQKCAQLIDSKIFRPPYGKISSQQIRVLKNEFKIVMWSVLSKDYDPRTSKEKSLGISLKQLKGGDIITLHDSLKAADKMKYVLENLLQHTQQKGWILKKITESELSVV
tara:strand:+ start:782 stop:1411 length:630 start_codon:yes stop_codon:yes gene_type:complete